jgi:alpha-glucosidase
LPWIAEAPGFGFSGFDGATAASAAAAPWLPQPESFREYAADRQIGVEGSTLELYRAALQARRQYRLGSGSFQWAAEHDPGKGILAFINNRVLVIANMGGKALSLPEGYSLALSSVQSPGGIAGANEGSIPPDSAVYLVPTEV